MNPNHPSVPASSRRGQGGLASSWAAHVIGCGRPQGRGERVRGWGQRGARGDGSGYEGGELGVGSGRTGGGERFSGGSATEERPGAEGLGGVLGCEDLSLEQEAHRLGRERKCLKAWTRGLPAISHFFGKSYLSR
uniref:Uncharacterized protein n=1 Tax=Molossus molossus TaxID=27622 RepID=A0A7J8HZT0_MOLMO|nr:hypothetical protein HJG59_010779 [Molossus molossus]